MEKEEFPIAFGEWVKQRRKALDLTQDGLAQRAGCSIFALRKIESGERRPSRQLAELLAEALEIPTADKPTFIRVARGQLALDRLHPTPPEAAPTAVASIKLAPHPLPLATTPLLGREAELAAMTRLFADPRCRLLTLTGMGGIGKTRLALEFGACQGGLFPGGIYFIPLAGLHAPELIVPAVAEGFGFTFSGPVAPKEQLIRHLAGAIQQPALLILDNLEHLIAPSATAVELVSELLQRLPSLKILATSRERLNLHGEWMYELHGLPTPPTPYLDDVTGYSAADLFMQSAQRANMAFTLTEEEKPALVQICQLLEGIPLALELAAAWSPLLSCAEIAQEVATSIDFLTTTLHDIPERHRSLRATFNHSWRLLAEAERDALCALAVFHGGFDRTAAAHIAGASLPLLASLASKSLIRRAENGRYDLHEVIRQYALLFLQEDQARYLAIRDRHCEYYLQLAASYEKALKSRAQQDALQKLTQDADNIRAAWLWGIEREKFNHLGAAVRCLGWMFEITGLLHEGIELFEPLVQALRVNADAQAFQWILGRTLTQQGLLNFRKGFFDQAQSLFEESLYILRRTDRPELLSDSLIYLGVITFLNGDLEKATALLEEELACVQGTDDEWFGAYAVFNLGYIAGLKGQYAIGQEKMWAGLTIWRRLGDPHSIAMGLNYLSLILIQLGLFEQAENSLQESLELCQRSENRWGLGTVYRHLGVLKTAQGELAAAETHLRQALETFGDYIVGWDIACSYTYLGDVMLKTANLPAAEENYLKGLRLAQEIGSAPLMLEALAGMAELEQRRGSPEWAWTMARVVCDHAASPQVVKDRADRIIRLVEDGLDHEVMQMHKESDPVLSLEAMVTRFSRKTG